MANVTTIPWYVRDNSPAGAVGTGTVGWSAVTAWHTPWTPAAGTLTRQVNSTPAVNSERVFVCTVSGAVSGAQPTWIITKGGVTTDTSATWVECTGQPGVNGDLTNTPTWAQQHAVSTAVTTGLIIQDAAGDCLFICVTSGTIGGSEPTWTKTVGTNNTDNTAHWVSLGAASNYADWAAPHARIFNALTTSWAAAGNNVFVGSDHAEAQSTQYIITGAGTATLPCYVYSINTSTTPPTSATLLAGASTTCTGTGVAAIIAGHAYYYGITINSAATGAGTTGILIQSSNGTLIFDTCALALTASSGSAKVLFGGSGNLSRVEMNNSKFSFAASGQTIELLSMVFLWRNTASAISGTVPTTLFSSGTLGVVATLDGVDLSALGSGTIVGTLNPGEYLIQNCKLGTGFVASIAQTEQAYGQVDIVCSDSSATNYQCQRYWTNSSHVPDIAVVRTGGASNGTTSLSWKLTTGTVLSWGFPFACMPIGIWNSVTSTNRVVTLYGVYNGAALPNNDQIWFECEYLGDSGSPLSSTASCAKTNGLATGSALTADTSAWDSMATTRTNSETVAVGAIRKVPDNPGRIFICTAIGTGVLASSEPGGMTSAVDGTSSITDGGATWRCAMRFSMAVTLSSPQPQLVGDLYCIVKAALPSSTFWIDPLVTLA